MRKIRFLGLVLLLAIIRISWIISQQSAVPLNNNSPQPTNSPIIASESAKLSYQSAEVVRVVDGDTIEVKLADGQDAKLRLVGINTPETVDPRRGVQCFGHDASDETKKLLTGQTVYLEKDVSETDKYGRLLRIVYLPTENGLLMVNDYLVRQGFAQVSTYPPDVKYQSRFLTAQQEAQAANRGLWASCGGKI